MARWSLETKTHFFRSQTTAIPACPTKSPSLSHAMSPGFPQKCATLRLGGSSGQMAETTQLAFSGRNETWRRDVLKKSQIFLKQQGWRQCVKDAGSVRTASAKQLFMSRSEVELSMFWRLKCVSRIHPPAKIPSSRTVSKATQQVRLE